MLKTVVVGSVSVLVSITSQPSAREQVMATVAAPSLPPAPASKPTDAQQLLSARKHVVEALRAARESQATPADAAAADAALANAVNALNQLVQSRTAECTFALKMKEVDPNVDSRIHVGAPEGGRAKIRRILPPACLK
jgi:hypothetical protein